MFKKILFTAVCATAALLATACSSVQIATDFNDLKGTTDDRYETVGHVNVDIWGIYIFGLPIIAGSDRSNGGCRIFDNTVTTQSAIQVLTGNARAKFKSQAVVDIKTERTTSWIWPTIFFVYKDIQASGTVLK